MPYKQPDSGAPPPASSDYVYDLELALLASALIHRATREFRVYMLYR